MEFADHHLEIRNIDFTFSSFMTFTVLLVILSLETKLTGGFCFLVRAKIGELTFPLAAGSDILKAPFSLEHDTTFATDDYDCQVMNQGAEPFIAIVHCCYTDSLAIRAHSFCLDPIETATLEEDGPRACTTITQTEASAPTRSRTSSGDPAITVLGLF
uniref:Uncharacterized protein n=1 Tax=Echinococcus granulosus TaxID=6210 RepID=A0A068WP61_ECHGR|nr:hypothetical protein EgrG_000477600 [Echinococcus granulosus]